MTSITSNRTTAGSRRTDATLLNAQKHRDGAPVGIRKLYGNQTLVAGNVTNVKIGGRFTTLPYPPEISAAVKDASQNPKMIRQWQAPPNEDLVLEYAYGFNGNCEGNLHAIGPSECMYNVGSLGVLFDFEKNQQRFFTSHSEEVTAIAFCPETRLVVTGQQYGLGQDKPWISLWCADDPNPLERRRYSGHLHSIYSLAFSKDGAWIFSVGAERLEKQNLKKEQFGKTKTVTKSLTTDLGASGQSKSSPVFVWSVPTSDCGSISSAVAEGKFPTTEAPMVRLERIEGTHLRVVPHPRDTGQALAFSGRVATLLSLPHGDWSAHEDVKLQQIDGMAVENEQHPRFTGFHSAAYVIGREELLAIGGVGVVFVVNVQNGSCVRSLAIVPGMPVRFIEMMRDGEIACGGEDGGISFLSHDLTGFTRPRRMVYDHAGGTMNLTTAEHFVLQDGSDALFLGTAGGRIARAKFDSTMHLVDVHITQQSPSGKSNVSALCTSPVDANQVAVADCSGGIHFFDAFHRHLLQMPPYMCRAPVTSLAWGVGGKLLAAAQDDGHVEAIRCHKWEKLTNTHPPRCQIMFRVTEASTKGDPVPVSAIRFSPNEGKYLACGSSISGDIYVYRVYRETVGDKSPSSSSSYRDDVADERSQHWRVQKIQRLTGNATTILALQFSNDESYLASNARDGQVLCWAVESGKRTTPSLPSNLWFEGQNEKFQLIMSWPMIGIWNQDHYATTTALVAEAHDNCRLLAAGDEFGRVKLHRFPLPVDDAASKTHHGHCSKVSKLAWTEDNRIISAGAAHGDGLLQWRLNTCPPYPIFAIPQEEDESRAPVCDATNKQLVEEINRRGMQPLSLVSDDELEAELQRRKESQEPKVEDTDTPCKPPSASRKDKQTQTSPRVACEDGLEGELQGLKENQEGKDKQTQTPSLPPASVFRKRESGPSSAPQQTQMVCQQLSVSWNGEAGAPSSPQSEPGVVVNGVVVKSSETQTFLEWRSVLVQTEPMQLMGMAPLAFADALKSPPVVSCDDKLLPASASGAPSVRAAPRGFHQPAVATATASPLIVPRDDKLSPACEASFVSDVPTGFRHPAVGSATASPLIASRDDKFSPASVCGAPSVSYVPGGFRHPGVASTTASPLNASRDRELSAVPVSVALPVREISSGYEGPTSISTSPAVLSGYSSVPPSSRVGTASPSPSQVTVKRIGSLQSRSGSVSPSPYAGGASSPPTSYSRSPSPQWTRTREVYEGLSGHMSPILPNSLSRRRPGPGPYVLSASNSIQYGNALSALSSSHSAVSISQACHSEGLSLRSGPSISWSRNGARVSKLPGQSSRKMLIEKSEIKDKSHGAYGSARLCDMDGRLLAQASVWLYHPPFKLTNVVTYVADGGLASETFLMPKSWGVLRSRNGLLVWLCLFEDAGLTSAARERGSNKWSLSFDLCSHQANAVLNIRGHVEGYAEGKVPLDGDEGLLHSSSSSSGEPVLRIKLNPDFDAVAKLWLSEAHICTDTISASHIE